MRKSDRSEFQIGTSFISVSGQRPWSVYMRTGEMKLVPVWVRFGLSDRSENSGRPEILM